ncbi:hypothetical protein [Amnibacterium kyonggiense]|uniref:hypothetical protein n=1 Tax=Amnibacterium kyonggiense TaxID=595671 RepID=UPI00105D82E1|nr:hypothetical protein [Amnibacterium kyonggiense]
MALRDRVVLWALGSGSVLSLLAWHFVHPWAALVVGLLALAVAGIAYRIEKPRIDLDHPEAWRSAEGDSAEHADR